MDTKISLPETFGLGAILTMFAVGICGIYGLVFVPAIFIYILRMRVIENSKIQVIPLTVAERVHNAQEFDPFTYRDTYIPHVNYLN
jgi:hypothetical protein